MKPSSYRLFFGTICCVALAGVMVLAYRGHPYYLTPLIERPRHTDYWVLKPGGTRGHLYGVIGISLLIVMHVYSVRRRVSVFRSLGRLRAWLDFHILCGVVGPLLIALHSSFKVQGLVAVSFWSMWAVACSGLVGRFIYAQIPRRRSGHRLTLKEIHELNETLTERLRDDFGLSTRDLAQLQAIGTRRLGIDIRLPKLLLRLPLETLLLRWRVRRFAHRVQSHEGRLMHGLVRTARQKALIERRLHLLDKQQRLFHNWHVFHMPFALLMYVFVIIHVAVAIATGYGWPRQ